MPAKIRGHASFNNNFAFIILKDKYGNFSIFQRYIINNNTATTAWSSINATANQTNSASLQTKYIFKREVTLNHPYPFDLGVIWSDPPRRMICLEPWTSPRNSFVDGCRNIIIPSNDSKRLNASIQIKSLK